MVQCPISLPFPRRWKNNSSKSSSTGQFDWPMARPILADTESGTRENEVITPWSQMPNLIQLAQGTEQALPLYDPVHGSGPGEIVFLAVLPTAMIRYMVVVLGDGLPPHERCPAWRS